MRRLIVTENVSADGVMAPMEGWFDPARDDDDALIAAHQQHMAGADALVLGRDTFEAFASYWPQQTDDRTGTSDYLNEVDKYVFSSSMADTDWQHSTILRGDVAEEVAALKDQPGRDITITGSLSIVRAVQAGGLVDAYRLFVYPAVQGHGDRVFPDGLSETFELTDCRAFETGVVLLEYASATGDQRSALS